MSTTAADAAASRARSTADRLAQLKVRLDRLERGEPATPEDVRRARQQALAQAQALAMARDRLLLTHRLALARERDRGELRSHSAQCGGADLASETGWAEKEPSGRSWDAHAVGGPAWLAPARPSGPQPASGPESALRPESASPCQVASADPAGEIARLRQGVAALLSWTGAADLREVDRRQSWCRHVVQQCGAAGWRGWIDAVCRAGSVVLSDTVRGIAITIASGSGAEFAAASDRWASLVQGLETILGEGPSKTAHANNRVVVVNDLATERLSWQGYASASAGYQVRGICALPLQVSGVCVGSLTLYYRTSVAEGGGPGLVDATTLAGVAAAAVLADIEQIRHGGPAGHDRFTVHVATGALAARLKISTDEAESRLRAFAFRADLTLEEAAQQALAEGLPPA